MEIFKYGSKIIRSLSLIFLTLIIGLVFSACSKTGSNNIGSIIPEVNNGILDLTGWDINKTGSFQLNGAWEFYWNKLLESRDLTAMRGKVATRAVYVLRRELRYSLYFAMMCITMFFALDMVGQFILLRLIPGINLKYVILIWYTSTTWVVFFFILYIYELFKSRYSAAIVKLDTSGEISNKILKWLTNNKKISYIDFFDDSAQFIENFAKEKPELAFIRLGQADISGIRVARLLKSMHPDIKIVFISDDKCFL